MPAQERCSAHTPPVQAPASTSRWSPRAMSCTLRRNQYALRAQRLKSQYGRGGSGVTLGGTTTGAPYADISIIPTKIYVAVGNSIQRITDDGASGSVDAGFTYNAGATVQSGTLPYNGYVYFGRNSGQYHCYNGGTMTDAANWPYQNASGNATTGPWIDIISNPNQVLFGTDAGDMHAFNTQ